MKPTGSPVATGAALDVALEVPLGDAEAVADEVTDEDDRTVVEEVVSPPV